VSYNLPETRKDKHAWRLPAAVALAYFSWLAALLVSFT